MRKLIYAIVLIIILFAFGCDKNGSGGDNGNETGSITGTVSDSSTGQGISGATVTVDGTDRSATTDTDGTYTIEDLEAGTYNLTASATGYNPSTGSVTVTSGEEVTLDLSLSLQVQTGTIKGTVKDATNNNPIQNATVTVQGTGKSATTDAAGLYEITGIAAGSYTVAATATGYTESSATVNVSAGGEVTQDFTLTPSGSGTTYYVSPDGNNANPGTRAQPWKTPGYGSRQLSMGDTLIILGGRYQLSIYDDDIIIPPSGTANGWITVRGETGNRPVLAGRNDLMTAIILDGVNYIKIENLEITSDNGAFFREAVTMVDNPCSNIILQNLYIHRIDEFGVDIADVLNMQILNCRIEYCGFGAVGGPSGSSGGIRNLKIQGCSLSYGGHYYQGGDGSNRPYDRPDGFGIEASNGPIEIYNTTAEHNYGDGLDSKARNTYIHHCIVANNSCDGVKLWGGGSKVENTLIYGTGDGDATDSPWAGIVIETEQSNATFEIINVTLHENAARKGYPIYVQYGSNVPINLTMKNTIIANAQGHAYFENSVKLTAQYNLFYMPTRQDQVFANGRTYSTGELSLLGAGNAYGNPLFEKTAWGTTGNYKVKTGSPAIDTGTGNGAPADDLEHTARPQGNGYDKGAYER